MSKGETGMSNFLEQWVVHDGKPITARLLSILKRCHISTAHECMSIFHDEMSKRDPESTPFTSWIIKGPLKAEKVAVDSQNSTDSMDVDEEDNGKTPLLRESLLLVTQDKLKETESKFERITVKQVYSFSPRLSANHTDAHKIAAVSQLTTIQHELHANKDYTDTWEKTGRGAELGTIRSAEKWGDSGQPDLPQNGAGPSKPKIAAPVVKNEPIKEEKKQEKKLTSKDVKKAEGLDFAKAKSGSKSKRKLVESDEEEESSKEVNQMEEDEDDEDDAGPIGYSMDPSKGDSDEATKGGKAIRKRADAGDKLSAEEERKRKQKQELMDMMDEDEAGDADPPAIKPAETASTSMMKGTDDIAEDIKASLEEKATEKSGVKRRVRKQRKIMKKVKTKDSKGYTRTQDVEEYESYSSDESDTPAAVAPHPPKTAAKAAPPKEAPPMTKTNSGSGTSSSNTASKKGASTAGGGQRKLASFFTKK